jgi:hypothetical protein
MQCEHLADAALELRAFAASATGVYRDWHGVVQVQKAVRVGALAAPPLVTCTWLFRQKRRRLVLEPLTLPPDAPAGTSSQACATAVDF